jgi:hypothetical protein
MGRASWVVPSCASALLAGALLAGCGDARDGTPAEQGGARPPPASPASPTKGHREVIDPSDEADQRSQALEPRDAPLAVGATAPTFEGLPAGSLTALVFYRGDW